MKITGFNFADLTIDKLITINGFSSKTAKQVITMIPEFIKWIERYPQIKIIDIHSKNKSDITYPNASGVKVNPELKKNIVITGFRDKDLINKIESSGGKVQSGVNSKTDILIVKDNQSMKGSKYNKALELKKEIITLEEFNKKIKQ